MISACLSHLLFPYAWRLHSSFSGNNKILLYKPFFSLKTLNVEIVWAALYRAPEASWLKRSFRLFVIITAQFSSWDWFLAGLRSGPYIHGPLSFPPLDSGSGWSSWFPSLAMSLPPSHIVYHPHISSGLRFQEQPQLPLSGWGWEVAACDAGPPSVEIWVSKLWDLQAPTQQYKPREREELKTEKLGTGGISLDGRLGFWRVGNIGLESGESEHIINDYNNI